VPKNGVNDRRVEKTRGSLHMALASLIHEKSYEDIVVKEILARANVGRSTFYSHFRDKDHLLESSIGDMLGDAAAPAATNRAIESLLHFSLPILEHIERYGAADGLMTDAGAQAVVYERLERQLVRLVADELGRFTRHRVVSEHEMPTDLLAHFVASTFVVVLNWWVASDRRLAAAEVNEAFRALVLPALAFVFSAP